MKKTIKDFNLNNKKVIIRVDFNVPIKNGIITDEESKKLAEWTLIQIYKIQNNSKLINAIKTYKTIK